MSNNFKIKCEDSEAEDEEIFIQELKNGTINDLKNFNIFQIYHNQLFCYDFSKNSGLSRPLKDKLDYIPKFYPGSSQANVPRWSGNNY